MAHNKHYSASILSMFLFLFFQWKKKKEDKRDPTHLKNKLVIIYVRSNVQLLKLKSVYILGFIVTKDELDTVL